VASGEPARPPEVSVVVPAFDAAATLAVALDSLERQTHVDWEAIVVDDGSRDGTAALVAERARRDPRLRLLRQPNGGVSRARNAGIALARAPWLAFLDADDWLHPEALATLLAALRANPRLDGVHCGWTRIAPDGREAHEICPRDDEDMFAWHAHNCAFAIHAVMVRRELVQRAGGFDPSLATCEDWDLWLRLSRLGARWARVERQLACYRIRTLSASMASRRMLRDGLVVIDRAHGPDPRLDGGPHPRAEGEDPARRARARLVHGVYSAGLAVGQGEDGVVLLDALADERCPGLTPDDVAYALYEAVPLGRGTVPADWAAFPERTIAGVLALLEALERISGAPQLARRAARTLERLVGESGAAWSLPGRVVTATVDLEQPLADVEVPDAADRLVVAPCYGELRLERVELPACDGRVPAALIADAVAAEHAWSLLGAFFAAGLEGALAVRVDDGRLTVRRGSVTLVDMELSSDEPLARLVHDYAGWELLLQEAWGAPETPNAAFYDPAHDELLEPAGSVRAVDGWVAVELSEPLPEIVCAGPVHAAVAIGGATLAALALEPLDGRVSAGALRREICTQAGFELCRLVVRQGLLGRPRGDGVPLRARLREAAAAAAAPLAAADASVAVELAPGGALAPGWERHARAAAGAGDAWVVGRRRGAATGLAGSRVALLPRGASSDALAGARAAGDPVVAVGRPGSDAPLAYAPDVVWSDPQAPPAAPPAADADEQAPLPGPDRAFFEALFARGSDPWSYTSEYEQGKYAQTLALLGRATPQRALELGCAEGHFTRQLARHVGRLRACDISLIALERARARCADLANVEVGYHDVFADPIDGGHDLIVCSELLYYAGDRERLDLAARAIAGGLAPRGMLLTAHANVVADDPDGVGFDWAVPFGAHTIGAALAEAGLELVRERVNQLYRVQAYRPARQGPRLLRRRPRSEPAPLPQTLPDAVAQDFRSDGAGSPAGAPEVDGRPVTWELPILMYHRVAPHGSERLREWRVTPAQLEQQLHYLASAGYRSASFDEWRTAAEHYRPLPGRRVLLTFDDGYEDFAEHAHPLLRRYGFEATVFLVSDRVGGTNEWDRDYGETVGLMDWETIRALDGDGVEFGAHSATHPLMTALTLEEVVREASRCRTALLEQLGHGVRAFAYPFGDVDPAVARTVGACGFEYAVTTAGHTPSATTPMLLLPRMNVSGRDSFEAFVRMLVPPPR